MYNITLLRRDYKNMNLKIRLEKEKEKEKEKLFSSNRKYQNDRFEPTCSFVPFLHLMFPFNLFSRLSLYTYL